MINFKAYEDFANRLNEAANTAWLKVTGLAVADVIGTEIDLRSMDKAIMELSSKCNDTRRELSKKMDGVTEEEFDELESEYNRVEDLFYKVDSKFSAIDDLISSLRKIQDDYEENEVANKFSDIKTINLGESIQIERFK